MPIFVFSTMKRSATSSSERHASTITWIVIVRSRCAPAFRNSRARSVIKSGNDFGSAPKTNCAGRYSRNSETPMAVMSTVSLRPLAQRPVGEPLDEDADDRADDHRDEQHARRAPATTASPRNAAAIFGAEIKAGERAEHEDIAVREIDEAQHAINHRVAQRDQRVDRAEREAVDELLEKLRSCSAQVRGVRSATPSRRDRLDELKLAVLDRQDHRRLRTRCAARRA